MDEACTRTRTPAAAAARNTRWLPTTFVRQRAASSWDGWMAQARWTTASASAKWRLRSSSATSAVANVVLGGRQAAAGRRRATPTTAVISGAAAKASTEARPTFPVAPVTTTRMLLTGGRVSPRPPATGG